MPLSLEGNRGTSVAAVWVEALRKTSKPGRRTGTAGKDLGTLAELRRVKHTTCRLQTGRGNCAIFYFFWIYQKIKSVITREGYLF